MKKIAIQFLSLLFMVSVMASPVSAASLPAMASEPTPAPATVPTTEPAGSTTKSEANPETVKSALDEFKNLSKHDRKNRIKEAKKAFKEYRATHKKSRMDDDAMTILLVILAILLPPLAVALKEDGITIKFWICLALALLTILLWPLWFLAVLYALLVVFDQL